jgi:hypothetical protein
MPTISNTDDVIDSRDVIERIEELEGERDALVEAIADAGADFLDETQKELADWDEENKAELDALKALVEEAEGYAPGWRYGAALVRDSYFEDYARELLEDIGDIPRNLPHYIEIDWEATARNIQVDYTAVNFDGVCYWVR